MPLTIAVCYSYAKFTIYWLFWATCFLISAMLSKVIELVLEKARTKLGAVTVINRFKYLITVSPKGNVELTSASSLETNVAVLNSLIPKSHFDCIRQIYFPGLALEIVYSTLYSAESKFLRTFFKTTSCQFSSFSCL